MTTVTLPRELISGILEKAAHWLEYEERRIIRAALDAPAKPVECRGCKRIGFCGNRFDNEPRYENCTDFDKFQALPPIVLTKVTK